MMPNVHNTKWSINQVILNPVTDKLNDLPEGEIVWVTLLESR